MPEKPLPEVLKKPHIWCFSTYFAEGFPYSIIRSVSTLFFRDRGVSLEAVGLTTFYGLPWILKFFWGPLVDEFASKRRWLLAMQATLAVLIGAVAFLVPLPGGVRLIAICFSSAPSWPPPTTSPSTATTWPPWTSRSRPGSWATG